MQKLQELAVYLRKACIIEQSLSEGAECGKSPSWPAEQIKQLFWCDVAEMGAGLKTAAAEQTLHARLPQFACLRAVN